MRPNYVFALVLCAALLVAAPATSAQSLEPGGSVDLLTPGGTCDTVVTTDPDDAAVKGVADCDVTTDMLFSTASIDSILDQDASANAIAELTYLFDVAGGEGTDGNTLAATIDYGVAWSGLLEAVAGTATVTIQLEVTDLTTAKRNKGVGEVIIHEESISGDSIDDVDSTVDSMSVELIRGHSYAVSVQLGTAADADATSEEEQTLADYFDGDNGVTITELSVNSEFDIAELVEQVLQNTLDIADNAENIAENALEIEANSERIGENSAAIEINSESISENSAAIVVNSARIDANSAAIAINAENIAENTAAILVLAESLDDLAELLAALREEFDGHSHTYLTGRGVGHNNTEATTTVPITDDDGDGSSVDPLPEQSQGRGRALGRGK